MTRSPWWAGLPVAEARLDCGGRPHRLRWAAGQLHALDHGDDMEGEQILSALGGQRFPCLDVLESWARHTADPRVLILASRGPADPVATWTPPPPPHRPSSWRRTGTYSTLSYHGGPREPEDDLLGLIGLGGPLPDRLAATVIAAWAERLRRPAGGDAVAAVRPSLQAALYGRAVIALRSWTGQRDLAVALTMIPEGQPAKLTRAGDGIAAELPFGWLADVWARGLTTCWGRFCLAAAPQPAGDGWVLSTVGPDLGPPHPVTLSAPPGS